MPYNFKALTNVSILICLVACMLLSWFNDLCKVLKAAYEGLTASLFLLLLSTCAGISGRSARKASNASGESGAGLPPCPEPLSEAAAP